MAILFSSLKSCLKAKRDLPFNEEGFLIINTYSFRKFSCSRWSIISLLSECCNIPYLREISDPSRWSHGVALSYRAGRNDFSHLRTAIHKQKNTGIWLILCLPLLTAEWLLLTTACLFTGSLVCWCMKLGTGFEADIRKHLWIRKTTVPTKHIIPLPLAASGNTAPPPTPYTSLKIPLNS